MFSFPKQLKQTAVVLSLAFGAIGAQAATVGLPITIEEGSVAGTPSNVFVADQLGGQYDEVVTFVDATRFTTAAIFRAGAWFRDGATVTEGQFLNGPGASGYNLYAKFIGSGTYSTAVVGSDLVTTFSATQNAIELWLDPSRNTRYDIGNSAGDPPAFTDLVLTSGAASITDDRKLGTASITLDAGGSSSTGLANGNFEIVFGGFTLIAPDGEDYFVAPRPFHMTLDLNGNFQSLLPVAGTSVKLQNSSANAFFTSSVPEPGALALVGAAFLALGVVAKRRKSA